MACFIANKLTKILPWNKRKKKLRLAPGSWSRSHHIILTSVLNLSLLVSIHILRSQVNIYAASGSVAIYG